MARYEWHTDEQGRRRVRRVAPVAESDPASLKKDDLVALAEARGVDASGTKAEILERLRGDQD